MWTIQLWFQGSKLINEKQSGYADPTNVSWWQLLADNMVYNMDNMVDMKFNMHKDFK